MSPARWPREDALAERLLRIDPRTGAFRDARVGDLTGMLRAGDLLVVNDAATLPASLRARLAQGAPGGQGGGSGGEVGADVELRLLARDGDDATWWAALLGAGDWRTPTEHRPAPPRVGVGAVLAIAEGFDAEVVEVSALSPRRVRVRFSREGGAFWRALYAHGRVVQYSYVAGDLALWHVQTRYGARPWSVEMPSAGRPLAWSLLLDLARRGVALAAVTHACGLSSTGDPAIDAALPFPERYAVPRETVDAVRAARARGGRVVAAGTSVVRALEGCAAAHGGELVAAEGVTDLVIRAGFTPRVVDGLLTGMHEPEASHFALLQAFAPIEVLSAAYAHADAAGYLCHEFGDSALVLAE